MFRWKNFLFPSDRKLHQIQQIHQVLLHFLLSLFPQDKNVFIHYKRLWGGWATSEELDARSDAKGAEICLFDYSHGFHPSCSDNFVHLRLNPFVQIGVEWVRRVRGRWRGKGKGRFEYDVKIDLLRYGNNYMLRAKGNLR